MEKEGKGIQILGQSTSLILAESFRSKGRENKLQTLHFL